MRKDKLSSYQAKKQKLLDIKNILQQEYKENKNEHLHFYYINSKHHQNFIDDIWGIVKDE